MQYYNSKDVYFGCLTYNTKRDGFYHSSPETFIKVEDGYLRLSSQNNDVLKPFSLGTKEYLTVSRLFPMIEMMKSNNVPDTVSTRIINMYLLKYKLFGKKEINNIDDYKKTR